MQILVGIGLAAVIIVGVVAGFYLTQNNGPTTTFEVLPIATPQWDVNLEKPAAFINLSIKNEGGINETNVVVKLSGGFSNSSSQVPDQLYWIVTKNVSIIKPGEIFTISRIFDFGWYFFYRVEVSSSTMTKETFNQWVEWRSWTVPQPT
jgi:hypothetical protein